MRRKSVWRVAILVVGLLAIGGWLYAAEHPEKASAAEHPEKASAAEHPEEAGAAGITKEELADAIKSYVKKDSALKGGYFMVYDSAAGKPIMLSLQKVHEDRLSSIGHGVYFACADFETPDGKVYDLDIFMKGPDKDHLAVTKVLVHKEDGVARYTWHEEGGKWKKHYVEGSAPKGSASKGSATEHEHPSEHPAEGSGTK